MRYNVFCEKKLWPRRKIFLIAKYQRKESIQNTISTMGLSLTSFRGLILVEFSTE